jgi:hypothetical protein
VCGSGRVVVGGVILVSLERGYQGDSNGTKIIKIGDELAEISLSVND